MKEISKDDLYEGLLCHGLFADKLPPIFSNIDFYNACINGLKLAFTDEPNDYIRYNSTRNTNVPRLLGIPTPFTYLRLCNVLYDNWDKLINFFDVNTKNQRFKYSQIHIQKLKDKKAIFEMNHDYNDCDPSLELELCRLSIVKKYQVKADISSCFPSIYSHALTWAINGKDAAKYNQKDKKDFANTLDKCSRQLKNNETNGLLIGPHTSNLLSEIILCSVDKALADKGYEFIRHIDDYCCYLESEEQAEQFILDLSNELKKYELTLNTKKTTITTLPITTKPDWIIELNKFFISCPSDTIKNTNNNTSTKATPFFKYQRLKTYIDLCVKLANENKNSSIYSYAIKVISNYRLGEKAKLSYIITIHQLLCMYPYLVHWVDKYVFEVFNIPDAEIGSIVGDLYATGKKRNIYEACSFAIYWYIKYNLTINIGSYADDAILSDDCIFLVMALLLAKKQKNDSAIAALKERAKVLAAKRFNQYWLFIYEALDKNAIDNCAFKCLKKRNVSFIEKSFMNIINPPKNKKPIDLNSACKN